jgi:streptogramin lyase
VQSSDNAPNGLALTTPVDLNGGSIFPCLPFNAPDLSGVKIINGYLWVADKGNNRILELGTTGTFVQSFGSSGTSDSKLSGPTDVKIDSSGNIWVADSHNYRIVKYDSTGQWLMTIGGATTDACGGTYVNSTTCAPLPASADGGVSRAAGTTCCAPNAVSCTCNYGSAAGQFDTYFGSAQQLAFDTSGNLWVTDYNNSRVQEFNSTTGQYLGGFTKASSCPSGLAIDNNNSLWVSADYTGAVYKCTTAGSCTKVSTVVLGCNQCTDYVTIDPSTGNVWANDQGRTVYKFSSAGTYLGRGRILILPIWPGYFMTAVVLSG